MSSKCADKLTLSRLSLNNYNIYDSNFTELAVSPNFVNRIHPTTVTYDTENTLYGERPMLTNYDNANGHSFFRKSYSVTARQEHHFMAKGNRVSSNIGDLTNNKNTGYNSELNL